jgi:hypothetical protein
MASSRRRKLTIIPLVLYWPVIFILSHIPIARIPPWVIQTTTSDKALHYLAYLILVFLLWFAISPDSKVNWRRPIVWWVLSAVIWYGALDEWLQGYVRRTPDVMDFFADLSGVLTGLILLSIFPFWSASLALAGTVVFVLTNFMQANLADLMPVTNTVFHLSAYGLFTLLWIQCIHHYLPPKPPEFKWLAGALIVPAFFLSSVKLFVFVTDKGFRIQEIIVSLAAIVAVVITIYMAALLRCCFNRKLSASDFQQSV